MGEVALIGDVLQTRIGEPTQTGDENELTPKSRGTTNFLLEPQVRTNSQTKRAESRLREILVTI
jgi:hypothetical protein